VHALVEAHRDGVEIDGDTLTGYVAQTVRDAGQIEALGANVAQFKALFRVH